MPRRVVPICSLPSRRSRSAVERHVPGHHRGARCRRCRGGRAWTWPRDSTSSTSPMRTAGSTTQPAPYRAALPRDEAGRELPDLVRLFADHDRVPRVRAALVAAHEVGILREQVDDLALPLVAPLRTHDDGRRHARQCYTRPSRSGPRRRARELRVTDSARLDGRDGRNPGPRARALGARPLGHDGVGGPSEPPDPRQEGEGCDRRRSAQDES